MVVVICIIIGFVIVFAILSSNEQNTPKKSNSTLTIRSNNKKSLVFDLAGVHVNKPFIMNFCKKGDIVKLEFEPDNKYDENAIKVMHGDYTIGYVPSVEIDEVNEFIENYDYYSFIYKIEDLSGWIIVEIGLVEK
jgi:hypothetical protein